MGGADLSFVAEVEPHVSDDPHSGQKPHPTPSDDSKDLAFDTFEQHLLGLEDSKRHHEGRVGTATVVVAIEHEVGTDSRLKTHCAAHAPPVSHL
ncbi:MAG: hypothetical protein GDA49_13835 [Rhodospirillales bacterium]|nr:hypothetical protein [Rhodospirillales bacterium]